MLADSTTQYFVLAKPCFAYFAVLFGADSGRYTRRLTQSHWSIDVFPSPEVIPVTQQRADPIDYTADSHEGKFASSQIEKLVALDLIELGTTMIQNSA